MEIKLTRGLVAQVSDCDGHLSSMRWHAHRSPTGKTFYAVGSGGLRLHRLIMGLEKGNPLVVDHMNGNGLDCRRENLRIVSRAENVRNQPTSYAHKQGATPLGVSWHKGRNCFVAHIRHERRQIYLGRFNTAEEANHARLLAEARLWGIQPRRQWAHDGLDGKLV